MMTSRTWLLLLCVALAFPCTLPMRAPFLRRFKLTPPSPAPTPKPPPCPTRPPVTVSDIKLRLMLPASKVKVTENHIPGSYDVPPQNCTQPEDDGDGTVSEPVQYDHWKLHIIMACTVTAAVEFVLIIFIILYWRQIRWTLRKITCPCDNCRGNRHEAMEQDEEGEEETNDLDLESGPRSRSQGRREHRLSGSGTLFDVVQTFSAPRQSKVQSAVDDAPRVTDIAVAGPSGIRPAQTVEKSQFKIVSHTYSDESLSDDNDTQCQVTPGPTSPSHNATAKNRVKNTKRNPQSPKGKCGGYRNVLDSRDPASDDYISVCDPLLGNSIEISSPSKKRVSTSISSKDFNQSQGSVDLRTLINSSNHSRHDNKHDRSQNQPIRTAQAQEYCSDVRENAKTSDYDSLHGRSDSPKCDKNFHELTNQHTAEDRVRSSNPDSFLLETKVQVHC